MKISRSTGIVVNFDDALVKLADVPVATAARHIDFDGGLIDMPSAGSATFDQDAASTWITNLLAQQHSMSVLDVIALEPQPAVAQRSTTIAEQPVQFEVPVSGDEQVVVLLAQDGVLSWQFGTAAEAPVVDAQRGTTRAVRRVVRFNINLTRPALTQTRAVQRGFLGDLLLKAAKAFVLRFVAKKAVAGIVHLLEHNKRTGPVIFLSASDPAAWGSPENLSDVLLPVDRPARILLLIHGTFSSTVGGFGELCATPWGQRFLTTAMQRYDAVLGFDHVTLSKTPLQNGQELLAALKTLATSTHVPQFDIVCHSRGGLVVRSLTEKLLPAESWKANIGRVVFVAATNRGTELARPGNWHALVDLYTNLAAAASRALSLFPHAAAAAAVAEEVIDGIADLVKYMVTTALADRLVPGLAAMDPAGEFVLDINLTQPGQVTPAESRYFAVVSNFNARILGDEHEPKEFPKQLALALADGLIDQLMAASGGTRVPNDLVVDDSSMTAIDAKVGGFVKDVLDYGDNAAVYHTNYFIRTETVQKLAQWLQLPMPLGDVAPARLLGADTEFATIGANASVQDVRELIRRNDPGYLVVRRLDPVQTSRTQRNVLHYAVRPSEFAELTKDVAETVSVETALDLHEHDQSKGIRINRTVLPSRPSLGPSDRSYSTRTVVMDGEWPAGVLEPECLLPNTASIAELAREMPMERGGANGSDSAPGQTLLYRGPISPGTGSEQRYRGGEGSGGTATAVVEPSVTELGVTQVERTVHGAAEMPAEVRLGETVGVTVTLSAESIAISVGVVSATGAANVDPNRNLSVEVMPKSGFDYSVGGRARCCTETTVPSVGKPIVLDFEVVASREGAGEVWAILRQGAMRVLRLVLHPVVVANAAKPRAALASNGGELSSLASCGGVPTLTIVKRDPTNEGSRYAYFLEAPGIRDMFESALLEGDPSAYVAARYKDIETAWLGSNKSIEKFAVELEAIGGRLFRELFPIELQRVLYRLRRDSKLASVLVQSEEPFIPWEVVFIDDPDAQGGTGTGGFLAEHGMCRWLWGSELVCTIKVRDDRRRYVIPHYPLPEYRLQKAESEEEPMLQQLLGAQRVVPHHAEVLDILSKPGAADLLHFACHGAADPAQIDDSALLLEGSVVKVNGSARYAPEKLRSITIAQRARLRSEDGQRPLIVLNACQAGRLGYALTGLGGFATAFLGNRVGTGDSRGLAGAFVGSLWSVYDEPASTFVEELYTNLKQGKTMGEAATLARKATRDSGDATWLAYAVYAHPNTRVEFS